MQLIDEDDGVLILHQLLHDGFEPLFELAAILGAGHDQRKIERQNALVGQERRHVALGDLLRQTFHNGGLAHARLADQHRIVLGAAAENLDHALQFVIAADQRIERIVHGGLGQVAGELRQQRTFLRPVGATFSDCERCNSSRMVESRNPRSCRISAAKHFSSRSRPSSRCSVPMCL